jgi:hypothetical protein
MLTNVQQARAQSRHRARFRFLYTQYVKEVRYMQTAEDIVRMKNNEIISVSPQATIGDVLKASLYEKTEELEKLNGMVSWAYYEEWRWNSDGVKA